MSDRWTEDQGPCACGKGRIVKHVKEDDHPWVSSGWGRYESIEIECAECGPKPPIERRVLSQTQIDRLKALAAEKHGLRTELESIRQAVVNDAFPSQVYPTKKAEWEELTRQGLFRDSYAVYCRKRYACVYDALRHRVKNDWVLERCDPGQRSRAESLIASLSRLDDEERAINQSPELTIPMPAVS